MRSFSTGWWQDRQKQRAGLKKSDVTSPTAATDLVLITAEIDVTEGQGVSAIDAPGSFLTADIDEEVILILENKMVDAMLEIDREIYGNYVIYAENEKNTHVCSSQKGDARNAKGSTYLLQKNVKRAEIIWVRHKPIQPLRRKKLDKRRTTYPGVACRRHESVAQK